MEERQMQRPWIGLAISAVLGLLVVFLGLEVWAQNAKLEELTQQLVRVDAKQASGGNGRRGGKGPNLEMVRRVRALEAEVARLRRGQGARTLAADTKSSDALDKTPAVAAAPVPVQSATVLDTLESENPAVQQRVRDVMRRELQALRKERREERWSQRRERASKRFEDMATRASLTDDQVEALEPRLLEEREQIRTIFREARKEQNFDQVRSKIEALRTKTDGEVRASLDEDQYKEYAKMREEEAARFQRRGRGR